MLASFSADDLISTDHQALSKAERWQLIDQIDARIDRFQTLEKMSFPGSLTEAEARKTLQALRLKRFTVWNSFYPKFNTLIRIGCHAN
ncbi:hypothetical protein DYU11_21180 [Fibrisoma montanum]|uniref:Uncharacterized protein n=2 Tax=Fibrisoma montanum TaxID=2305895 RepID=A0A418M4A0_9BACT|nr:hypothetical protein DYU11_21180 [Fibrisoma montanum]